MTSKPFDIPESANGRPSIYFGHSNTYICSIQILKILTETSFLYMYVYKYLCNQVYSLWYIDKQKVLISFQNIFTMYACQVCLPTFQGFDIFLIFWAKIYQFYLSSVGMYKI